MDDPGPRLRLLGVAACAAAGGGWQTLARPDAALLARLALDGPQRRTALAVWLWPGAPMPRAHANLRQRLLRLRRSAGALVQEDGEGLSLAADAGLTREDADFEAVLLDGLVLGEDPVSLWIEEARRRWLARRADRMAGAAARLEREGRLAEGIALVERLLVLEPLSEHAWRTLMRLHVRRGDRAAAVAAFDRCASTLRDELGLGPAPETLAQLAVAEAIGPAAPTPAPGPPLAPLPLFGREAPLQRLREAWAAGAAAVLIGEAGLGKTALLDALVASWPGALRVAAYPGDADVPYALMLRLLRAIDSRWPVARWCPPGEVRAELARLWPALGPAPDGPGMQAALHAALLAALQGAAGCGLQAVAVDDLQHADAASASLLRTACVQRPLRWAFSGLSAPMPARLGWPDLPPGACRVVLAPLDGVAMEQLLNAAVAAGAAPPPDDDTRARMLRHAAGNPLFLLELLRHRDATGAGDELPPSIEAVLRQRLARLAAPTRTLLRIAAVLGGSASPALVAEAMGRPLAELSECWHEAETAQWLGPGGEMTDPARRVLLGDVPAPVRQALHARAAELLARAGAPAAEVARQWLAAGQRGRAAVALEGAAAEARRLGRPAEQELQLRAAAEAFADAGEPDAAFAARLAALEATLAAHGPDRAFAEADELERRAPDATAGARLSLARAALALGCYRFAEAERSATAASGPGRLDGPEALRARLLRLAARAMQGHDVQDESQPLERALRRVREPLQAAHLWDHWALTMHAASRVADCSEALDHVVRHARRAGHPTLALQALASRSSVRLQAGDIAGGLADARDAMRRQRRLGDLHGLRASALNLAIGLVGIERPAAALALLDRTLPAGDRPDELALIAQCVRAEAWLRAGQPGRALALLAGVAPDGQALPTRLHHALLEAWALQADGQHALAAGRWQALRALAPPDRGVGVALRARALASVVAPPHEALAELDGLVARAGAAGAPAAEGIARLRRAAQAWRCGRRRQARADVDWLLQRRAALRHLYVPTAELLALALRIRPEPALRRAAIEWRDAQLLPRLPPGCRQAWARCPAWAELGPGVPHAAVASR